jgi:hypothetical protein
MTRYESIYLSLLCAGMLGGIAYAFTGIKGMRAAGHQVNRKQRLAVYLGLFGSACFLLGAGLQLASSLLGTTSGGGNWSPALMSLSVSVMSILAAGTTARAASEAVSTGDQPERF